MPHLPIAGEMQLEPASDDSEIVNISAIAVVEAQLRADEPRAPHLIEEPA